jgi:hypothetical protein
LEGQLRKDQEGPRRNLGSKVSKGTFLIRVPPPVTEGLRDLCQRVFPIGENGEISQRGLELEGMGKVSIPFIKPSHFFLGWIIGSGTILLDIFELPYTIDFHRVFYKSRS